MNPRRESVEFGRTLLELLTWTVLWFTSDLLSRGLRFVFGLTGDALAEASQPTLILLFLVSVFGSRALVVWFYGRVGWPLDVEGIFRAGFKGFFIAIIILLLLKVDFQTAYWWSFVASYLFVWSERRGRKLPPTSEASS